MSRSMLRTTRAPGQGKYSTGEEFSFTVSNVNGFRAKVRYQSGSTVKYQDVLIRDASFRIGNFEIHAGQARQGDDQDRRHQSL